MASLKGSPNLEERRMTLPLRIAVVGAGPAGLYAADILTSKDPEARVDIFDRLPTPFGLIRYGVAPDHPRISKSLAPCTGCWRRTTSASSATCTSAST